jgi:palmitoyl-protein thioesterase
MTHRLLLTVLTLGIYSPLCAHTPTQPPTACSPIVLITNRSTDITPLEQLIKKHIPHAYVTIISLRSSAMSAFYNLYDEVDELIDAIYHDNQLRHGFTVIASGSAGLTARYYLERYNMPPIHTYIALGTPQRGVYGLPGTIDPRYAWLNSYEPYLSTLLYLSFPQRYVALSNYWNDPLCHDEYLNRCCFLPYINNEKEHEFASLFKQQIISLHAMVLIAGVCDDTVEPSLSAHFGYFKKGTDDTLETITESEIYQTDSLGLKTLHQTGRLHLKKGNCDQHDLINQEENFIHNILPFLFNTNS